MESRPLRILALTHCDATEGCTFARIVTPLHALQSTGKVTYKHVRIVPWSVAAFWQILRDLSQWDVVWVARPRHYLMLPLIREARRVGKPVLIDIDDWLLDRPDAYNAIQWAGTGTSQETMRKAFAFAGVDESFTSEQFDREWEKSSAKQGDKYQFMEKLIKLPGFRSFDRNFDRLPESMRWIVEKVVHDPEKPPAPKPKLPDDLFETVRGRFTEDVAELQKFAGREFAGWHDYS